MRGRARGTGRTRVSVSPAQRPGPSTRGARDISGGGSAARPSARRATRLALRATVAAERRAASGGGWSGRAGLKVTTREAGLHFLSAAEIAGPLGMPAQRVASLIRTGRLALSHRGRVVPYLPDGGDRDLLLRRAGREPLHRRERLLAHLAPGPTMSARPAAPAGLLADLLPGDGAPRGGPVSAAPPSTTRRGTSGSGTISSRATTGLDAKSFTIRAHGRGRGRRASLSVHLLGGTDSGRATTTTSRSSSTGGRWARPAGTGSPRRARVPGLGRRASSRETTSWS